MNELNDIKIHRGLKEIYLDRTKSSFIDGKNGKLYYRGFNINELASYLRKSVNDLQFTLFNLTEKGFITYDIDRKIVSCKDKLFNYIDEVNCVIKKFSMIPKNWI